VYATDSILATPSNIRMAISSTGSRGEASKVQDIADHFMP
jgi:hypothetical protein